MVKEKWRIDFVGKIAGNSTPQRERALGVRDCLIESGDKIGQNKRLVANSESVRVRLTWEEVLSLSSIWISISIFFVVFWYFSVVILINSCAFVGKRGVHCLNKKLIYSTHWSRWCEIMMARKTGKTSSCWKKTVEETIEGREARKLFFSLLTPFFCLLIAVFVLYSFVFIFHSMTRIIMRKLQTKQKKQRSAT